MTTSNANAGDKPGFFAIYKPGQGKYVRWGTVAALGLIIALGMYWVYQTLMGPVENIGIRAGVVVAFGLLGALLTFIAVNRPRSAEFMIMTESEMRKVTWPTRATVMNSTKVVIFLTLLMAVILWAVDYGFFKFFHWIGIL